jgi:hypothetical protein
MMRPSLRLLPLVCIAACGGDAVAPPDGAGGARLSARIDGTTWEAVAATVVVQAGTQPGGLHVQGSTLASPAWTLALTVSRVPGPGTYPLGVNIGTATGGTAIAVSGSHSWTTPLSGAAGSMTITSITDTRIRGTFNFQADAVAAGTAPARVTVASGEFDVPRPPGFAPATAAEVGSRVSATVNGTAWHAATVVTSGGGFGASNTEFMMTLVGPTPEPGTYPLGGSAPRRFVVQRIGVGTAWGGTAADQGSVTISSVAGGRLVGTFSATLPQTTGSGAPLVITNGIFDIRS